MSKAEKELMKLIDNNDTANLNYFIDKKLNSKLFKNKNKRELLRLLPTIMAHTNDSNYQWINTKHKDWFSMPSFIDTFIENMDRLTYQNKDEFLLSQSIDTLRLLDLSENQIKKLIDKIPECNTILTNYSITSLYTLMSTDYPKLFRETLKKYIKEKNTCNGTLSFIRMHGSENNNLMDLVYENIDSILQNNYVDLFLLKEITAENKKETIKVKDKIDNTKKESVSRTIKNTYNRFIGSTKVEDKAKDKLNTIVEIAQFIIEDVAKNEHANISELEQLSGGSYSTSFRIKDKIIKIGGKRGTAKPPNSPNVVATLLRKEFPIDKVRTFVIEVQERVDTKSKITEEELYQLYKRERKLGIIWLDVEYRNVGRLLKDNRIYWRQELPITDKGLGFREKRGNYLLKKGDIAICDNDLRYDEEELPNAITNQSSELQKIFERRYQQEKNVTTNSTNEEELQRMLKTTNKEEKNNYSNNKIIK